MRRLPIVAFLVGVASLAAAKAASWCAARVIDTRLANRSPAPLRRRRARQETVVPLAAVSYENGLLSIAAENASLRLIMEKVRAVTGAVVEAPPFAEPITVRLGPQPPATVLSALLEGSHLNYIIIGDTADARVIKSIQIMPEPAARSESPRPPPDPRAEAAAAMARALFVAQTGGDEGVWDNAPEPQSTPALTPGPPAVSPRRD